MLGKNIILVTGSCGFIGSSLIHTLLEQNKYDIIIGIDNFVPYYDVNLKYVNLQRNTNDRYVNYNIDISNKLAIDKLFNDWDITTVYHLAAQAGVRYSIEHPSEVINVNINGFQNILDNCIKHNIKHLVYASSSSVYGDFYNKEYCEETQETNNQKSPYALTKKCNEMIAELYSNLYQIKITGLRFFTVYGPYMRPDLAISKFVKKIYNNDEIEIYGDGNQLRDFTYIDDIIRIMIKIMNYNHKNNHEIFNIGYGSCISINELIRNIKDIINTNYNKIIYKDKAQGDVNITLASTKKLQMHINDIPKIEIHTGIKRYIDWYKKQIV